MLSKLKMVDVVRSAANGDEPAARVRAKLVAAVQEQKASVNAAIKKEPFKATRKVGGEERERRFRPWWFRGAGFYYTTVNYGTSPLQLPGGKSIEAGPKLEDLITVYQLIENSVLAGELDSVLLAAAAKRGRKGKNVAEAPEAPAAQRSTRRRA